jgi:hypothetical protein
MPREVDRGCGCGCLEAAVSHVHREARRARGAFLGDGCLTERSTVIMVNWLLVRRQKLLVT